MAPVHVRDCICYETADFSLGKNAAYPVIRLMFTHCLYDLAFFASPFKTIHASQNITYFRDVTGVSRHEMV